MSFDIHQFEQFSALQQLEACNSSCLTLALPILMPHRRNLYASTLSIYWSHPATLCLSSFAECIWPTAVSQQVEQDLLTKFSFNLISSSLMPILAFTIIKESYTLSLEFTSTMGSLLLKYIDEIILYLQSMFKVVTGTMDYLIGFQPQLIKIK